MSIKNNSYHNAENRMYYSIFYILSALAKLKNFSTSNHGQLMGWFNKEFINNNIFDKELTKICNTIFQKRQKGD